MPEASLNFPSGSAARAGRDVAMRVLLIEDDRKAAKLLAKGLQEEGFVVDLAATGEDGEEQAALNEYEVIVLDWLLPGKDGIAVCRALRARDVSTPILMLTARDSLADRVNGLSTGADDYLTKPFAFAELLAPIPARVSAAARPARGAGPPAHPPTAAVPARGRGHRAPHEGVRHPQGAEAQRRPDREPAPPGRGRVGRGVRGDRQPRRRPREPP